MQPTRELVPCMLRMKSNSVARTPPENAAIPPLVERQMHMNVLRAQPKPRMYAVVRVSLARLRLRCLLRTEAPVPREHGHEAPLGTVLECEGNAN